MTTPKAPGWLDAGRRIIRLDLDRRCAWRISVHAGPSHAGIEANLDYRFHSALEALQTARRDGNPFDADDVVTYGEHANFAELTGIDASCAIAEAACRSGVAWVDDADGHTSMVGALGAPRAHERIVCVVRDGSPAKLFHVACLKPSWKPLHERIALMAPMDPPLSPEAARSLEPETVRRSFLAWFLADVNPIAMDPVYFDGFDGAQRTIPEEIALAPSGISVEALGKLVKTEIWSRPGWDCFEALPWSIEIWNGSSGSAPHLPRRLMEDKPAASAVMRILTDHPVSGEKWTARGPFLRRSRLIRDPQLLKIEVERPTGHQILAAIEAKKGDR